MNSRLLIDDKPVLVLPKLAQAIGLNEAIVLQQVHFWLNTYQSADKQDHFHDGHWWVYNTIEDWHENFPWWSLPTVKRTLAKLRKAGLLTTTDQYNQHGYDRTLWYTINYEAVDQVGQKVGSNCQEPDQDDLDHQVNLTHTIPETTHRLTIDIANTEKSNGRLPKSKVDNGANGSRTGVAALPPASSAIADSAAPALPQLSFADVMKKATKSNEWSDVIEKKPRQKTEKQRVTEELSNFFLQITGLPEPPRNYAMLQKRWYGPLWYFYTKLADESVEKAKRLIRAAVDKLNEGSLTYDAPESLLKTARSLYASPEYGPRRMVVIA